MKTRKIIFITIIMLVVVIIMPNITRAELNKTISKINITVEEPVKGGTPASTMHVATEPAEAILKEEVSIFWVESSDGENWATMTSSTFESKKYYAFKAEEEVLKPEYIENENTKIYINNIEAEMTSQLSYAFVIDGIKTIKYEVTEPQIGKTQDGTATLTATPEDVLIVSEVPIFWLKSEDGRNWDYMELTDVFEKGKYYKFDVLMTFDEFISEDYMNAEVGGAIIEDFRTISIINGKEWRFFAESNFGPLGEVEEPDQGQEPDIEEPSEEQPDQDEPIEEQPDEEKQEPEEDKNPTEEESEDPIVEENKKDEEIVENSPETQENIKENTTKNPQTGDNILIFIGLLVISIIGILSTTKTKKSKK